MELSELVTAFVAFRQETSQKLSELVSQIDKLASKESVTQLQSAATADTQTLRDSIATIVADVNVMKGELTSLGSKVMEKTPAPPKPSTFKLPSLFD